MDTRVCDAAVELAARVDLLRATLLSEHAELARRYGHVTAVQAAGSPVAQARWLVLTDNSQSYSELPPRVAGGGGRRVRRLDRRRGPVAHPAAATLTGARASWPGAACTAQPSEWTAMGDDASGAVLVDGMNVIGSRPDGWWRDLDGAVRGLVDALPRTTVSPSWPGPKPSWSPPVGRWPTGPAVPARGRTARRG